jgi:hypothetical protein
VEVYIKDSLIYGSYTSCEEDAVAWHRPMMVSGIKNAQFSGLVGFLHSRTDVL